MILEKTNVAKEVSSIWTTEATISSTTFVGMHHLLIIDFYLHNENSTVNERLYYDVLVNVTIPPGIYVDPFELEARHRFGWKGVFIHTVSNDVDFESIRTPDDNSSTTLLLEYLSLPESSYTNNGQLSAQKYSHVDGHANYAERTCTDSHQCIHLQLQLPMHIRYQPVFSDCKTMVPLSESADSTHLHRMRLPVPAISLRPANVSHNSQAFAAINAGQNKSTHWLYNKTRLGNIGNNEFYSILYNKVPEYVAAVTNKNNDAVVFSYPGGCRDELSSVVCSNIVMVMCTTAIIVVLLFCKV